MKKTVFLLLTAICTSPIAIAAVTIDFEDVTPGFYDPYDSGECCFHVGG
ncbi:MAG TPA: hypothetical protein P5279_11785 [Anaerohalosphaeraceae bacterium]|nr:hypothetical protein [Anaerohalosphaeraceae bacterium]HRT51169.1 hypothetical protein [Anaerohalosphaeraceae bacterium]HRT87222.1 hypothetical protein [Anaerohalosphaeraceae bacterium]